jgi:molecular chaperone GrpE
MNENEQKFEEINKEEENGAEATESFEMVKDAGADAVDKVASEASVEALSEATEVKKVEAVLEKDEPKEEVKEDAKAEAKPKAELDELAKRDAKITELNKEITEHKNKYFRALADYQNLQRRTAKEQLEARGRGTEDFVKKLLPVLDTLDKAMEQLYKTQIDKKLMDGIEMFNLQFTDVLEKEGLKRITALGSKFDPNIHEAVSMQANPSSEDEVVLDVYEEGYIFKERVLRTSKVVINQL